MGKYEKLIHRILIGDSVATINFTELCNLLMKLGFVKRIKGSHHTFRKSGLIEKINL
jgi:hypothetical protein